MHQWLGQFWIQRMAGRSNILARSLCVLALLSPSSFFSLHAFHPDPVASEAQSDSGLEYSEKIWQVGVGRAKITPKEPMWMAGYASRNAPFQDVLCDIWAKAVLIEDPDQSRVLLVSLDLVGIERQLSQEICQQLMQDYSLERSQVAIATSHTHSGPVVGMNLRPMHFYQLSQLQQQQIIDYSQWLQQQVKIAVQQAFETLQPANLQWGSGTTSFATNRRNNPEPDVASRRSLKQLEGPVDHSVPVLLASDKNDNPLAIVFGYACHATVLSGYRISGDYPGFAQLELEERFPGCTAIFWAGCGADQNPLPRRTEQLAKHYGRQLATAVESVLLTHRMQPVLGTVQHDYREISLAFSDFPSREAWQERAESVDRYQAMRAKLFLAELDAGKTPARDYPFPVQAWKLGDQVEWVFLGGEVVVDYSARLKSERHSERTWVAGYANDVMAYIPSVRVLREGGYEGGGAMVYYGLPSEWSEEVEEKIIDEVHNQLGPEEESSGE
jgi:neutral ceramidase